MDKNVDVQGEHQGFDGTEGGDDGWGVKLAIDRNGLQTFNDAVQALMTNSLPPEGVYVVGEYACTVEPPLVYISPREAAEGKEWSYVLYANGQMRFVGKARDLPKGFDATAILEQLKKEHINDVAEETGS